jgi:rhodanese-related sulfurtransferase
MMARMKRRFAAVGALTAIAVAVFTLVAPRPARGPNPEPVAAEAVRPLTAQDARKLVADGALLVDVREPQELAGTGKLQGAINLPLTRLKQDASVPPELAAARQRPVVLYCRTGRRSAEAGEILRRHGFTRLYNLGGFEDAVKAGLPAA